jgi:NitT/TauT family transport system substrate-binding protein
MSLSRRGLLAASLGAATAGLVGCSSSTTTATPGGGSSAGLSAASITFGYIGDFNGTSLLAIAESKGMWAEQNIKATTKVFTNGPLQITALGTGDLHFGYIGPGAFWLPASGQAKIVAMNTLGTADRVIAQPGITSMEQLKGKKVGVPEGTSGDMILTLALKKAGMTKADIQVTPMDAATVVAAFSSKAIDGAGIWYPNIATIKKSVPNLVELAKNQDFVSDVAFPNAFVAGNKMVTDQKDVTVRVLKVLRKAMQFRKDNLPEAISLTAKMLKLDEAAVKADSENCQIFSPSEWDAKTKDGTTASWLKGMGDYFLSAKKITSNPTPTDWYLGDLFMSAK